jgi:hypothetical protein
MIGLVLSADFARQWAKEWVKAGPLLLFFVAAKHAPIYTTKNSSFSLATPTWG